MNACALNFRFETPAEAVFETFSEIKSVLVVPDIEELPAICSVEPTFDRGCEDSRQRERIRSGSRSEKMDALRKEDRITFEKVLTKRGGGIIHDRDNI